MKRPQSISTRNYLLKDLKPDSLERLLPNLEEIDAHLGRNLYPPSEPIEHVFFPSSSVASIVAHTENGLSTAVGLVGCEGAVGLEVVMGRETSPNGSTIQIAGRGHRIRSKYLVAEFEQSRHTTARLLAFLNKFLVQVSQTSLCNRLHSVEQRLARWLLMCHDRVDQEQLLITQENVSIMLGVTRASVTLAARGFQTSGLIKYTRGKVTIADYEGLQAAACECYAIVKAEYDKTECYSE